ncbi:hypothetical protein KIPB_014295, partial [Kipferlia bialata]|eukprot:g14295.t1
MQRGYGAENKRNLKPRGFTRELGYKKPVASSSARPALRDISARRAPFVAAVVPEALTQ